MIRQLIAHKMKAAFALLLLCGCCKPTQHGDRGDGSVAEVKVERTTT